MPYPKIKQTTEHPFHDPHTDKHRMQSRVAYDDKGNVYVWMWDRDGVGWCLAGVALGGRLPEKDIENVQRLLDEEPYLGVGR